MLRFRDETNPTVAAHNEILSNKGSVFWGLWLKSFESVADIETKLGGFVDQPVYIADTASKVRPLVYICGVKQVITDRSAVIKARVPKYYRSKIDQVPIWFELTSGFQQIDADRKLTDLLGVPTIYFLDYDTNGNIINVSPQREFHFFAAKASSFVLHLSDIHIGEDHAFRYPLTYDKFDINPERTFQMS